jgi:hypothetical protein
MLRSMRVNKIHGVVLIAVLSLGLIDGKGQTVSPSPSANLAPIAFLTAHEWDAQLPDVPNGKKRKIHAQFSWASNGQAIRVSNQIVVDGKRSPYIDGLYAWDPQQHAIIFWYVGTDGSLTKGTVKSEGATLVHDFAETKLDGTTANYMEKVTPMSAASWQNEILANTAQGLKPMVKVHYKAGD